VTFDKTEKGSARVSPICSARIPRSWGGRFDFFLIRPTPTRHDSAQKMAAIFVATTGQLEFCEAQGVARRQRL